MFLKMVALVEVSYEYFQPNSFILNTGMVLADLACTSIALDLMSYWYNIFTFKSVSIPIVDYLQFGNYVSNNIIISNAYKDFVSTANIGDRFLTIISSQTSSPEYAKKCQILLDTNSLLEISHKTFEVFLNTLNLVKIF